MTQELAPVWKSGRNGGIEFGNIKQLEIQEPNVYKLITWVEGFECNDFNYHYKVGKSKFGLWISRKLVSTENLRTFATAIPETIRQIEPETVSNDTRNDQIHQSHLENLESFKLQREAITALTEAILELVKAVKSQGVE